MGYGAYGARRLSSIGELPPLAGDVHSMLHPIHQPSDPRCLHFHQVAGSERQLNHYGAYGQSMGYGAYGARRLASFQLLSEHQSSLLVLLIWSSTSII